MKNWIITLMGLAMMLAHTACGPDYDALHKKVKNADENTEFTQEEYGAMLDYSIEVCEKIIKGDDEMIEKDYPYRDEFSMIAYIAASGNKLDKDNKAKYEKSKKLIRKWLEKIHEEYAETEDTLQSLEEGYVDELEIGD